MSSDTTVVSLRQPDTIDDPLTAILHGTAPAECWLRLSIAEAVTFLAADEGTCNCRTAATASCVTALGRIARSRPGSALSRSVAPSCATAATAQRAERIRFTSSILPRWARRTRSLDALLPILYLRGISTGDFQEALAALLGKDAPNLSPSVIARLRRDWQTGLRRAGRSATCRRDATSTSGPTASTCRRGWSPS